MGAPVVGKAVKRDRFLRRHKLLLIIALLASAYMLGSCADRTPDTGFSKHGGFDRVGMILWADRTMFEEGESIELRFTVINDGDEGIVIEPDRGPVMDISLRFDPLTGFPEIHWSDGRKMTPDMERLELGPGESKSIEMTWVADYSSCFPVAVVGTLRTKRRTQTEGFNLHLKGCLGF